MLKFFKKIKESFENLVKKDPEELKLELVSYGVPFEIAEKIVEDYKENRDLKKIIEDNIAEESKKINELLNPSKKPYVILVLGVNGSGKTTFIYKLSWFLKNKGKKVLVSASDTFRAAAIEQLEELLKKIDVPVIKGKYGQDPTSVAFDAMKKAKEENFDYVLIDTAGRLHSRSDLLLQIEKMKRKLNPDLTLLVVDSTVGQDLEEQFEEFKEFFDEVVANKIDIDDKSSVFFVAKYYNKPIIFLGTGQNKEDLKIYKKEEILKNFL
jgi:fused signal recognition particle receptor